MPWKLFTPWHDHFYSFCAAMGFHHKVTEKPDLICYKFFCVHVPSCLSKAKLQNLWELCHKISHHYMIQLSTLLETNMKHYKTNTKQNLAIIACVLSPHIAFCAIFLLFLKFLDTVFLQVRSPFPLGVYQSLFWCLSLSLVHNKCKSSEFFKAAAAIVVD